MNNKKDLAKKELLISVNVLNNYKEEDIAHDWGSMNKFFDSLVDEVEKLRELYIINSKK